MTSSNYINRILLLIVPNVISFSISH